MPQRRRGSTRIAVSVAALLILAAIAAIWLVGSLDREMVTEMPTPAEEGS